MNVYFIDNELLMIFVAVCKRLQTATNGYKRM